MNLEYQNFGADCRELLEPFLHKFGFKALADKREDYTKFYANAFCVIEASLIANFPIIEVSVDFLSLDFRYVKRSLLDSVLNIDTEKENEFFLSFTSQFDIKEYKNQIKYAVAVLKEFYQPVLLGKVRVDNI
jgi:hypothetical protein